MNTMAPVQELRSLEKLREQELEEARSIQSVMLPAESLRAGAVTVSHEFQPIEMVGGDFLDYFVLADGKIGLYLGDVSGKGLPATLYAALAVGTLRGVHKTGLLPNEVLATLNERLTMRGIVQRHAAIQYAVFDPDRSEMRIASAGMPGPMHFSANGCRVLELSDIPPGLFVGVNYENSVLSLQPGDAVLFYTDGIADALNANGEEFGVERLQAICADRKGFSSKELLSRIFSTVADFVGSRERHDDMAAALFTYE